MRDPANLPTLLQSFFTTRLMMQTLIPSLWTMPHVERPTRKQPYILPALGRFALILAA